MCTKRPTDSQLCLRAATHAYTCGYYPISTSTQPTWGLVPGSPNFGLELELSHTDVQALKLAEMAGDGRFGDGVGEMGSVSVGGERGIEGVVPRCVFDRVDTGRLASWCLVTRRIWVAGQSKKGFWRGTGSSADPGWTVDEARRWGSESLEPVCRSHIKDRRQL